MSKILSGKYKGRKIQSIVSPFVRPTLAKVKKSIFQILEPINGSRVLDLYSGFGSIAMLCYFLISIVVSYLTSPPPQKVVQLVEDIRIPEN